MSNTISMDKYFGAKSELALVAAIIGVLLVLFTPIPSELLDLLLIINLSFALLVLLIALYSEKPLEFSTFPTLLLIATLFRLALNIAATRLILTNADGGEVIGAVGNHVVGGSYIIGLVIFFILIIIQFVVVTNGAQRVAEVAARFTLDSMPGKQMSIDADLNMGLIDDQEAKARRKYVEREANFYGAMDGASKFVKGDAIAGILIILIDIIGGLTIGIGQLGMSWPEALHKYTLLTVGDGIVTQIPALIISTATGIIITRAATDKHFSSEITRQITQYPKSLVMVALMLLGVAFLKGIPTIPVVIALGVVLVLIYMAVKHADNEDEVEEESTADDDLYSSIDFPPLEIVVGNELIKELSDETGKFMSGIEKLREQVAQELGYVFPYLKIVREESIGENEYQIKIYGNLISSFDLYLDKIFVIGISPKLEQINGIHTKDPSYSLPAVWIDSSYVSVVEEVGATVVEPITVLITHFSETVKNHAGEFLTHSEVSNVIKRVREKEAPLYDELVPNLLTISDLQKIFRLLLAERVSIRPVSLIFEALVDKARTTKEVETLTEAVRQRCGWSICESLKSADGDIKVLTLDSLLENKFQSSLRSQDTQVSLLVDPDLVEKFLGSLGKEIEKMMSNSIQPVLLSSPLLRPHLRKLISRAFPHLAVISLSEIPSTVKITSYGVITIKS